MITTTISHIRCDRASQGHPLAGSFRDAVEALDDAMISEFTPVEFSRMSDGELVRVIRAARLPIWSSDFEEHLEYQDRPTLERLVHLARRCCQHRQLTSPGQHQFFTEMPDDS